MASIPVIREAVERGRLKESHRLIVSRNLPLVFKINVQSHLEERFLPLY